MTKCRVALAVLLCAGLGSSCTIEHESEPRTPQAYDADGPGVTPELLRGGLWYLDEDYLRGSWAGTPRDTGAVRFSASGRWGGYDGCNREGGTYQLDDSVIAMHGGPATDIGCANISPAQLLDGARLELDDSGTHLTAFASEGGAIAEYERRTGDLETSVPVVTARRVTLTVGHCWVLPVRFRGREWFALSRDQFERSDGLVLTQGMSVDGTMRLSAQRRATWIDLRGRAVRFRLADAPGVWPTKDAICM